MKGFDSMKRYVSFFLACIVFVSVLSITAFAKTNEPTDSFNRFKTSTGSEKTIATRPSYESTQSINLRNIGLREDFGNISDIDCDKEGNLYVLSDNSRIATFDNSGLLINDYAIVDEKGEDVKFSGAKGISVKNVDEFYIADTKNARVLHCIGGVAVKELGMPDSDVIPPDFVYQPIKVAFDSKGYLYVLSDGSYYGSLLYDSNYNFVGFYGANSVKASVLTTLSALWDKLTKNDIKRSKTIKTLPYQFADIVIDNKDFAYTCTGKTSTGNAGQVRILSPGGSNILTGSENTNYGETDIVKRRKAKLQQDFCSIDVDSSGFIYVLDRTYGLIYIYDEKSNLIVAFGGGIGNGNQLGNFANACGLCVTDSKIFVADAQRTSVTVFERNNFGKVLFSVQARTLKSDYVSTLKDWKKVLELDSTNYLALRGLAKSYFTSGDYDKALEFSKMCGDNTTYSQSLQRVTNSFITDNFAFIFVFAIIIVSGLIAFFIISVKRKVKFVKNEKLSVALNCTIHPFNSFNDIRYKQKGSVLIATVLSFLFFASSVANVILSDFRYSSYDKSDYNILFQVAQTLGLIALWTVANWCVSSLLIGRGRLKDVYIVTAYATLPLIVSNVITTVISHFIISADSTLISGINAIAYILLGILITVGLMVIHDFSFPKVLASMILTVIFMILVVFVLFMIGVLLSQFWGFFASIFLEIVRL